MSYAANWCRDFVYDIQWNQPGKASLSNRFFLIRSCRQTHETLKHSIAGAGAGVISSVVTCPLDVVKTRLQNQGIGNLKYRGTVGTT